MAKTRLPYAPEFRRQMVELVHAGRTPEELAAEFFIRVGGSSEVEVKERK